MYTETRNQMLKHKQTNKKYIQTRFMANKQTNKHANNLME